MADELWAALWVLIVNKIHWSDDTMSAMTSQITCTSTVCSAVCSGSHQRKHQSSALLAFVSRIRRWPRDSPHKGPVARKMGPFDDVIIKQPICGMESNNGRRLSCRFSTCITVRHSEAMVKRNHDLINGNPLDQIVAIFTSHLFFLRYYSIIWGGDKIVTISHTTF